MAGFFSPEGSAATNPQQEGLNPTSNIWFHQVIHEGNNINSQFPSLLGFGVEPPTKSLDDNHHQLLPLGMMMMRSPPSGVQGESRSSGRRVNITCQDCGNQAKKECVHMRCRTCCKSRGFECQTHVKSTWVPAAKRREKQHQNRLELKRLRYEHHHPNSATAATSNSSLDCSISSTHCLAPSPSAIAAGGMEVGTSHLPREVRSAAVFKCVRVSPIDRGEDMHLEQLAYKTSVKI